jgi:F-type H+-transporting ATPase subunit delta
MGADEQAKLVAALEKRFDRKVRVESAVDASLIGGAVVRAGDLTIDGSVKARLARLAHDLTA